MPFHLLNFPKSNFAQRCRDKAAAHPHDPIFERVQRLPNHQSLPIDAFQTTHMLSPIVNCSRPVSATVCFSEMKNSEHNNKHTRNGVVTLLSLRRHKFVTCVRVPEHKIRY